MDTVIISIGHCSAAQGANSGVILEPSLLALAIKDSGWDIKGGYIEEYKYCLGLAEMIRTQLGSLGIKGVLTNRYSGADFNGGGTGMGSSINAANQAIDAYGDDVKCVIELHCNASNGAGTGTEYLGRRTGPANELGILLNNSITKALNTKSRAPLYFEERPNWRGMSFVTAFTKPSVLVELFFIDNTNDLRSGLINKQQLAIEMATALKLFIEKKYDVNIEREISNSRVKSSALVSNKLTPTISSDDIKTSALQTQAKLTPIERQMGEQGGDSYQMYVSNKVEVIGTKPIPFSSTLIDANGNVGSYPILREGGITQKQFTYPKFQAIDYTSDIPTGKYQIFANTLYSITSYESEFNSSGHTTINTGGNMRLSASQQIDVISPYTINLVSDSVLTLKSSNVAIQASSVAITGALSVNGGMLVGGGLYSQGGVSSPSFNGPAIIDKTNTQELYGYLAASGLRLKIGSGILLLSKPVVSGDTSISIQSGELSINDVISGLGSGGNAIVTVPPHLHYFKRLNGTLGDSIVDIQNNVATQVNTF